MEIGLDNSHVGYRLLVRTLADCTKSNLEILQKKHSHTNNQIENTLLRNEAEHLNVESCK